MAFLKGSSAPLPPLPFRFLFRLLSLLFRRRHFPSFLPFGRDPQNCPPTDGEECKRWLWRPPPPPRSFSPPPSKGEGSSGKWDWYTLQKLKFCTYLFFVRTILNLYTYVDMNQRKRLVSVCHKLGPTHFRERHPRRRGPRLYLYCLSFLCRNIINFTNPTKSSNPQKSLSFWHDVDVCGLEAVQDVRAHPEVVQSDVEPVLLGVDVRDDVEDGDWTLSVLAPALAALLPQLLRLAVLLQAAVGAGLGAARK